MLKTKLPTVKYRRKNPNTPEFFSDLEFDYNSRTDLNLIDRKAGEVGNIKNFVVGDFIKASSPEINLGNRPEFSFGDSVDDSPFWLSAWINMRDATSFQILTKFSAATDKEFVFNTNGIDELNFAIYDQNGAQRQARVTAALTALEDTWIHVMACYNGVGGLGASAGIDIYIDKIASDIADNNAGVYVAMHNTVADLFIGLNDNSSVSSDGLIYDARIGTGSLTDEERTTIFNGGFVGTEIFVSPDVYSGIDISGNEFHGVVSNLSKDFLSEQDYLFNNGFQQYWDQATELISLQIPYDVDKVPIDPGDPYLHDGTNYDFNENHPEQLLIHNLAECFINFNPDLKADSKFDIWDRSNVTIHSAVSRASIFYDASNPYTYHISELNQLVLVDFFNVGYAGRVFVKFETDSIGNDHRLYMIRILVYKTDKRSLQEVKVLEWSGDIEHAIDDGSGGYIEDINGYIILTDS